MPMKLYVGASQKVADDHGSRGACINLEIELDSSLATDAAKLQERIRQLFSLVRQSLTEELNSRDHIAQTHQSDEPVPSRPPLNGPKPPNGRSTGGVRPATPAQIKALFAIAKRQRVNLHDFIRSRFTVDRPADLTLEQASELIDALTSAKESTG